MSDPTTAREALIASLIGDVAILHKQIEALGPVLEQACEAMGQADERLSDNLARFEARMSAISESAKVRVVQHLAAHADKAARLSVEQQSQAMTQAARAAFSHALGDSLLYVMRQRDAPRPAGASSRTAEWWLTHAVAAAAGSAATLLLVLAPG